MSQDLCCSFCQQLPTLAQEGRTGSSSKCPLCKQALWVTPGGATSRLLSAEERAAAPTRAAILPWLAGAGVGMMAGLFLLMWHNPFAAKTTEAAPAVTAVEPPAAMPVVQETPRAEGPSAQVKLAPPMYAARAKPSWRPAIVEPAPIVQAVAPIVPADPVAPVAKAKKPAAAAGADSRSLILSEEDALLAEQLRGVREADLDSQYHRKSKAEVAKVAEEIAKETKADRDAFVKKVKKDQRELAGLPFLMGDDCSLAKEKARTLAVGSLEIRAALGEASKPNKYASLYSSPGSSPEAVMSARFWDGLDDKRGTRLTPETIPALRQILLAENRFIRLRLAQHLQHTKDVRATEVLANRAVFDLVPDVRAAAVRALGARPKEEYQAFLLKSLRYPWEPAVLHAAQALAALQMTELVPELVAILDLPDPNRPFASVQEKGEPTMMVRELVRINHHRNCMLCHAPVTNATAEDSRALREVPVGPVPSVQESLPPSNTTVYYSARRGVTLVRADITYLRQDFSLMQKVDDHGKWPEMQRFDFLVRTRELSTDELAKLPPAPAVSEFKQAVLFALRELTGKDAPPQARAWREVLGMPPDVKKADQ